MPWVQRDACLPTTTRSTTMARLKSSGQLRFYLHQGAELGCFQGLGYCTERHFRSFHTFGVRRAVRRELGQEAVSGKRALVPSVTVYVIVNLCRRLRDYGLLLHRRPILRRLGIIILPRHPPDLRVFPAESRIHEVTPIKAKCCTSAISFSGNGKILEVQARKRLRDRSPDL